MMMKLLLIACFLVWLLLPVMAQTQNGKSLRELYLLLQKSEPDTNRVQLLYVLGGSYISNPDTLSTALDSALSISQRLADLSAALHYSKGQAYSYLLFSRIYARQGNPEKGKAFVQKAMRIFSKQHYLDDLGEAYFEMAGFYALAGPEMTERIRLAELGLHAFQQSGNLLKQANGNKELGDLYQIEESFAKSLENLKAALTLYQSIGYPGLQGVYDLLGYVSAAIGDYREALRYGLLAAQTAEQLQDSTMQLATIYNRLGLTYDNLHEFDHAIAYFHNSIEISKKHNDYNTVCIVALNIISVQLRSHHPLDALALLQDMEKKSAMLDIDNQVYIMGNFVEIYRLLKRYPLAGKYGDRLLALTENAETINEETKRFAYLAAIKFFLSTRQYDLARHYLLAHQMVTKEVSLLNLSNNHLWWFKLDSAQGNYQSALAHYQQYKAINDSLFNVAKSQQIAQWQVQFEINKKDQNIQLLTKQGILQQTKLQQANLIKNITTVCVVLLLIIISLLYSRYRLKQRSSKKLEAQQREINAKNVSLQHLVDEKEWLLKEVHHRVKNNLQIVMSLLSSQSAYLENDAAMLAIRDSQHRVQAISLIHQKLYQSESLSSLDMPAYIRELVAYLRDIFDTGQRIRFEIQVDQVQLDVSYAVPVGLILNEAITNGIKYAFPKNREGVITISFRQTDKNYFVLTMMDNGIGLPARFDSQQSNSLGMSLMRGLTDEIGGHFTIESHEGTVIVVGFMDEPSLTRDLPLITSDISS